MTRETIGAWAAGILAGAVIGAGLGLLYAPQSGRKTRREIQKQALEMKDRADEFICNIKERDEEFRKAVKEGADNYRREMLAKVG